MRFVILQPSMSLYLHGDMMKLLETGRKVITSHYGTEILQKRIRKSFTRERKSILLSIIYKEGEKMKDYYEECKRLEEEEEERFAEAIREAQNENE